MEAESYAKDYRVSVPEAQRRLDRSAELDPTLQAIASAEKGRVAGWGIAHEPTFGGWVLLTGDEPASSASHDLQRANGDITIRYGATHTFDELETAIDDPEVMSAVPRALLDHIASTDIDMLGNSLVLTLESSASEQIMDIATSLEPAGKRRLSLTPALQAIEKHMETATAFPFMVNLGSPSAPYDVHGGELVKNGTSPGQCTSGFAVVVGSTRAMLSAGHCSGGTRHYRSRTTSPTGSYYSMNILQSVYGHYGDAMVYTTSQWESDDFYVSTTTTQDATGYETRSNMMGDYVCHFGVSSGYSCGNVTSITFDPNYTACPVLIGCKNQWVKVEGASLKGCKGDSGGPWFLWSTAYGILSGGPTSEQNNCTAAGTSFVTFTAMNDVLSVLGVNFATT